MNEIKKHFEVIKVALDRATQKGAFSLQETQTIVNTIMEIEKVINETNEPD